jgi:hypothetical protein
MGTSHTSHIGRSNDSTFVLCCLCRVQCLVTLVHFNQQVLVLITAARSGGVTRPTAQQRA